MSVRILYDLNQDKACFYDATNGIAFGPVFEDWGSTDEDKVPAATSGELAQAFLDHLQGPLGVSDPRSLDPQTLANTYERWRLAVAYVEPRVEVHDDDGETD